MNTQSHRAFKVGKSVGSEINWSVHNDGGGEDAAMNQHSCQLIMFLSSYGSTAKMAA